MVYGRTIKQTLKLLKSKHSFKLSLKKTNNNREEKTYDARKCRESFFAVSNDDIGKAWPRTFPNQIQQKTNS